MSSMKEFAGQDLAAYQPTNREQREELQRLTRVRSSRATPAAPQENHSQTLPQAIEIYSFALSPNS